MVEKINKVSSQISGVLHNEIKKAQESLNSVENQKCMGKRKKHYTFTETSHLIGKYLSNIRKEKKKQKETFI